MKYIYNKRFLRYGRLVAICLSHVVVACYSLQANAEIDLYHLALNRLKPTNASDHLSPRYNLRFQGLKNYKVVMERWKWVPTGPEKISSHTLVYDGQIDLFSSIKIEVINKVQTRHKNTLYWEYDSIHGQDLNGHLQIQAQTKWPKAKVKIKSEKLREFFPYYEGKEITFALDHWTSAIEGTFTGTFPPGIQILEKKGYCCKDPWDDYTEDTRRTAVLIFGNDVASLSSCKTKNDYKAYGHNNSNPSDLIERTLMKKQGKYWATIEGHTRENCILLLDINRNILLKAEI